jgi:uncharacterized protein YjbJ (UPF0337 family)
MNKMRGIADKSVGLGKEFVGTLIGNDRLVKEGEAQQDRAAEELRALRKEVEAQKNEAKAEVLEQRQRAAQRSKENA